MNKEKKKIKLALEIIDFEPDVVCVHSPQSFVHNHFDMFEVLLHLEHADFPTIVWCHGFESLKFKYYPLRISTFKDVLKYPFIVVSHWHQLRKMKEK